jgi:hypothetical protein
MEKSRTPVSILITVALLAIYSAYSLWIAISEASWISAAMAGIAAIACIGAAMLRPWSQFLIYPLTATFIATWCYSLYSAAAAGYFNLVTASEMTFSLAPGIFLILISCFCSYAVFKQFGRGLRSV